MFFAEESLNLSQWPAVAVALINMIGAVLMSVIREHHTTQRHAVKNGSAKRLNQSPDSGSRDKLA
jgi:heme exporter protein D